MKNQTPTLLVRAAIGVALLSTFNLQPSTLHAQGTAFTYQGQLQNSGALASGTYNLTFTLFTTNVGGAAAAGPVTNSAVKVTNGLFTVTIDFGASVWNGSTNWLQIGVETNGGGSFTVLSPRQELTPTPYAIAAENLDGTVGSGALSGVYSNAVALTNPADQFAGNGAGLTNVNAAALDGLSAGNFWQIGGNSGVTTGSNYIGNNDNQYLDLHANGVRVFRLRLMTDGLGLYTNAPNVIGGSSENLTAPNVVGATIGGGGGNGTNGAVYINQVKADFGTVGGGANNTALSLNATVSGGYGNTAYAIGTFVGGGGYDGTNFYQGNAAQGPASVIGGGVGNLADGYESVIGGGFENTTYYNYGTVGGGWQNFVEAPYASVVGGNQNNLLGTGSFIGGGGTDGTTSAGNFAGGNVSVVVGGIGNTNTGYAATIGGGQQNTASNIASTVSGGSVNVAGGSYSVVAGGFGNVANYTAAVGGGSGNNASGFNSTISGGFNNTAGGYYATVAGGDDNSAGGYASFAAGQYAQTTQDNTFIWGDGSLDPFAGVGAANTFNVLSSGGVFLYNGANGVHIDGLGNNNGTLDYGIKFGGALSSGEGIASKRTAGGNQYGLDFYTSSSERMSIAGNGFVGINTTSPSERLEVNGNYALIDGASADDGNGPIDAYIGGDGSGSDVQIGSMNSLITSVGFWNQAASAWMKIACSSITINGGSDLAEPFDISAADNVVPQGAVVVIDKDNPGRLKISNQAYDKRVAGVVSGANGINPGIQMQQQGLLGGGKNVALSGRVYVQADASNGPIEPGDLLTTSSIPGRAMKVTDSAKAQGAILGKAMTGLDNGQGMVLVLVTLQ